MQGKISENILFKDIDTIVQKKFSLKNIIIFLAIKKIPKFLQKNKNIKSLLSFDDLLPLLLKKIQKNSDLVYAIKKQYPVTFIDEFQDTDIQQYQLFNLIYQNSKNTALLLIGDPKQAIYSFRGADIFSYLHAKNKIRKYYYLNTNWRSSTNMCKSINTLFSRPKKPFLLDNIPFISTTSPMHNKNMCFKIKGKIQTALQFFLQPQESVYIDEYEDWITKKCAYTISYWLTCAKSGDATITTKKGTTVLTEKDICILVRNKNEAQIIQTELKNLNIISNYSSQQENIFDTMDANELLSILQCILNPMNENIFSKFHISPIIQKISFINKKIENNYLLIEKFYYYHKIWKKYGIYCMIKKIITEYQSHLSDIEMDIQHQKIINFLHLGEILEKKFNIFFKKKSLLHWLEMKILQKKNNSCNEKIRFLNKSRFVQINTIHKSKGLEYPLTWIPFSINFYEQKRALYHNHKTFKFFFDIESKDENIQNAEQERLSEDLRFLYVALTRSILHCSLGIASLIKKRSKKTNQHSDIHQSSLGYIIQKQKSMNYSQLSTELKKLSKYEYINVTNTATKIKLPIISKNACIALKKPIIDSTKNHNIWSITSYTKINSEKLLCLSHQKNVPLEKNIYVQQEKKIFTAYHFPQGKNTGHLLHNILKNLILNQNIDLLWLSKKAEEYQIGTEWIPTLYDWINNILNTPFQKNNITLSKLKKTEYIQEFEFLMPIKNILNSQELNQIIQLFDPISAMSPTISFNDTRGFIKGFVDLVFIWEKKYYIIDYKSNWLGQHNDDYSENNIKKEIIKHRYDLQYQIYTLAIHKYLKEKIKKYNYSIHFGGVLYIFLRAIDNINKNGIFYTIPDYQLIKKMMVLFSGENSKNASFIKKSNTRKNNTIN